MLRKQPLETFAFSIMEFVRNETGVRDAYILDAPYQRGAVWTTLQKQNLIKSLLLGIPIGAVIISQRPFDPDNPNIHAAVVDGQQRIRALRGFVDSDFAVPADWFADDTNPRTGEPEVFIETTCGPIDYDGATVEGVRYDGLTRLGRAMVDRCAIGVCKAQFSLYIDGKILTPEVKAEFEQAEADLYLLVNWGGVDQTDDDRARAEAVARGNG